VVGLFCKHVEAVIVGGCDAYAGSAECVPGVEKSCSQCACTYVIWHMLYGQVFWQHLDWLHRLYYSCMHFGHLSVHA
jgi:hypothetical protein